MAYVLRHAFLREGDNPPAGFASIIEYDSAFHIAGRDEGTDLDVWWWEWVE